MATISLSTIEQGIDTTADTVIRNESYFSDLDGLAGDGDFGTSLATGFKVIKKDLPDLDKSDIGTMLLKISMIVSKHVGGSSGPIWGTGFMKAAMPTKGKSELTLQEFADAIGNAVDGIMARGGAKLGDKTLLDAVIPVAEKLKDHAEKGTEDLAEVLKDCATIADGAVETTRSLVAHRGRASQVGERSANTPDPGIVAIATILADWCKANSVEYTPAAPEVAKASA
ncbi:dihydroxyacetone kinase subunit DhaL [Aurantiacibacter poecillastricola]|uniref:dihydroxyacetone kinase subunit DhaL n=1 Tax=Aurantiacibacter poecillastricola TaxID=3064385 RepID=UPI00273F42E4|nr:dihydroxyacetone kinase subunit DhaL [Aurantiacibacter sp. 219JJ12-13]MDP5263149.1 dihydroxyacetone kinase subunit DhaL [Aurantiacibacter sp. 219JJ12-13]